MEAACAGTYIDVTSSASFASSDASVAALATNANGAVSNRIRPSSFGSATISATLGSQTVNASVAIVGSTSISSIALATLFDSDGVDASDPSVVQCSSTFRGDIGATSELVATFYFADNDVLACPVTVPVGSLSRTAIQDDYITLQSALSGIASDRSQSVTVVAPDWLPPHPSGFDLLLQDSAPDVVTLTATSTCVAAGVFFALAGSLKFAYFFMLQSISADCGAMI